MNNPIKPSTFDMRLIDQATERFIQCLFEGVLDGPKWAQGHKELLAMGERTRVTIESLSSTGPDLDDEHLRQLATPDPARRSSELPVVWDVPGERIITDGNHRVAGDYLRNESEVDVILIKYSRILDFIRKANEPQHSIESPSP